VHGVPADLDLTFLNGAELIQVCLGQYQLVFQFHPAHSISVEGSWDLLDSTGALIDGAKRSDDWRDRPPYHLHRLLGRRVTDAEVAAPEWFALRFESGESLRIFDDSDQYESFSIGGLYV
jgi:hypothetical protein